MTGLSLIIPAHNEAAVIQRTLRSILASAIDRPLQILVVANGCTDDTARLAREIGPPVEVIETPIGSKTAALNLGDRAARHFPRAFLDADVALSPDLLPAVLDAFNDPAVRLVAPAVRYLYPGRNPFLAGYYRLWQSLPYVRDDTTARGFYAIDEQLRRRFDQFPDLTADDRFIHNLTRPDERRIVHPGHTIVSMPATLRDLLAVKTRWTYGNLELRARRSDLNANDPHRRAGALPFLLRRPHLWIHLPLFLFVYLYAHRAARRRLRTNRPAWARAHSSRLQVAHEPASKM